MSKNNIAKQPDSDKKSQTAVMQSVSVSSPLPPPEWMEKYNNVNSDIVREILDQFRDNGKTGRDVVVKQLSLVNISQWHGFWATLAILGTVTICIFFKQERIALALLSLPILGAVKALIRKN